MRDIFVRLVVCGVQQLVVLGSRRRVSLLVRTLLKKYYTRRATHSQSV